MKPLFFSSWPSRADRQALFLFFFCMLFSTILVQAQPGVVGYSIKVFAEGPQKIKVKEPTSEIIAFEQKGVALVIPKGWEVIHPDSAYYKVEAGRFKINLCSERGDQVWVWRESSKTGYYLDEKIIADEVLEFAPINEQIKTVIIKGDGPDVKLYIWQAYHIRNGKKEPFTVFAAYKPEPIFGPYLGNAKLFGRSSGMDNGKTEADIIEMAKYLQTYDNSAEDKKKNKGNPMVIFEDEAVMTYEGDAMTYAVEKASGNFDFNYLKNDTDEKPAEYNGQHMEWPFETYPGWANDEKRINEQPVSWSVPSIVRGRIRVKETIQVSPQHLLLIYTKGLAVINIETRALLWYHKIGYDNCNLAAGTRENVIIYQSTKDTVKLKALETLTGNELWSGFLEGESPKDWLFDNRAGVLIAVQEGDKETNLTGLDMIAGKGVWKVNIDYNAGLRNPPLPELAGENIITYSNGIEAISSGNGTSVWKNGDLKLEDQCPNPQIKGDTLIVLDKDNKLNWIDTSTGRSLQKVKVRESAQYTNIFPLSERIYLRGKLKDKDEPIPYFIDAMDNKGGARLWSYSDTIMTVSNLIDDGKKVYASTWQGPVVLDRHSGVLQFRKVVSEVGKTYPVSIRQYGDTIVYLGEVVIAGVDGSNGEVLYHHGFDPVSQTMNLDAIDPNCEALVDYLKFYGKVGLEGNTLAFADAGLFFNLSAAAQEQATKLSALGSYNRSMYIYYGESSYNYKSRIAYNQSMIESSFARAYASVGMMMNIVPRMSKDVSEMTKPERNRYFRLMNYRKQLMALYNTYEVGDYAFRKMGNKVALVHLPSGLVTQQTENERSLADIILNPDGGEFYYHELRMVPELEGVSDNTGEGTAAHAYYLVANPLK